MCMYTVFVGYREVRVSNVWASFGRFRSVSHLAQVVDARRRVECCDCVRWFVRWHARDVVPHEIPQCCRRVCHLNLLLIQLLMYMYICRILFCSGRSLAASAPIWMFGNLTKCNRFFEIVTTDFMKSGPHCSQNIRNSWDAINKLAENGLSFFSLHVYTRICLFL